MDRRKRKNRKIIFYRGNTSHQSINQSLYCLCIGFDALEHDDIVNIDFIEQAAKKLRAFQSLQLPPSLAKDCFTHQLEMK